VNAQQHAQSSRHYETEAEAIRYRLVQSLAELRDRLTPDQLFNEMMIYTRGGIGTFFRALSNAARENPLSTFLIGAGCMMFVLGKMGMSRYLVVPSKTISEASQRAREAPHTSQEGNRSGRANEPGRTEPPGASANGGNGSSGERTLHQ